MAENIMPSLIGNEKLKNILSAEFESGKPLHAYIIAGAEGSGKLTLARLMAASFVCENRSHKNLPCGECVSCRKVLSGSSVDVIHISNRDKATIGVDLIRQLKESLYITPNDGDFKFYIIENAHLMTVQAQNALLLSLEEPPPFAVIMLLCEDPSLLLETIRSRAPTFTMESFSAEFLENYLTEKYGRGADRERAVFASHLASGSIGRAVQLYEKGESELRLYESAKELVRCLLCTKKSEALANINTFIAKDRRDTCRILSLARLALRDIISSKKQGELLFYSQKDGVPEFTRKTSMGHLVGLIEATIKAEDDIAANCAQNTVMTSLLAQRYGN